MSKNCDLRGTTEASWPCLLIRNTRNIVKAQIHSPFLQRKPSQWETLRTRWAGHDYSVFPPRSWKLVVANSWRWIPPWSQQWGHLQWKCQQENKMKILIFVGTCCEDLCTQCSYTTGQAPLLRGNTNHSQVIISFLGSSSTTEACIYLPCSHHPVKNPSLGGTHS